MKGQVGLFNKTISSPVGIFSIVLFAVSIGGLLIWQYELLMKEESEYPRIEALERFVRDDTVGWEVYRSEEYDFEVRYPKSIELKESDNSNLGSTSFQLTLNEADTSQQREVFSLSLFSSWWEETLRQSFDITSETEIMLAGRKAKRIVGSDQTGFPVDEIWINHKKGILRIKGQEETLDQVLPTFRFLD